MLYKNKNTSEFANFGGTPDPSIWWVATEQEADNYINNEAPLKKAKNLRVSNRKKYLLSTDWYITREADSPNSYPTEIKNKRILARTEINAIESATTLAEVEAYNETFE